MNEVMKSSAERHAYECRPHAARLVNAGEYAPGVFLRNVRYPLLGAFSGVERTRHDDSVFIEAAWNSDGAHEDDTGKVHRYVIDARQRSPHHLERRSVRPMECDPGVLVGRKLAKRLAKATL